MERYVDRKVNLGIPGLFHVEAGFTWTKPENLPDKGTWNVPGDPPGFFTLYGEAFGGMFSLGGFWELI